MEIDQWFWSLFGKERIRLPKLSDAEAYRKAVPDDFSFTVKAPNSITLTHFHQQTKKDPLVANTSFLSPALFQNFLAQLSPLRDVLLSPVVVEYNQKGEQRVNRINSDVWGQGTTACASDARMAATNDRTRLARTNTIDLSAVRRSRPLFFAY